MDTKLLLPNRFKRIGWLLFVPCLVLTVLALLEVAPSVSFFGSGHFLEKWTTIKVPNLGDLKGIFDEGKSDFAGELLMTLTAVGFFFVAFSRERTDDEWITKVRHESLLWGFYIHLIGFVLAAWLSYGLGFYLVLSWNMLTAPLVFLARFHWIVYVKPFFEERRAAV